MSDKIEAFLWGLCCFVAAVVILMITTGVPANCRCRWQPCEACDECHQPKGKE